MVKKTLQSVGYRVVMTLRVISLTVAGWILSSGLAALVGAGLILIGLPKQDTMVVMALASFLLFIAIIMWGFVNRTSVLRPLLIIGFAVGVMMAGKVLTPEVLGS